MSQVNRLAHSGLVAEQPACVPAATAGDVQQRERYVDSVQRNVRVVYDGGWSHVMQNAFAKIRKCGIPSR